MGTIRTDEDEPRELRDRAALYDLAVSYCWTVDSRDWTGWADLFVPDGGIVVPYGAVRQPRLAEYAAAILEPYPLTSHMIANFWCEVDGDEARTRAYYRGVHVRDPDDLTRHDDQVGVYRSEAVRVDGAWKYRRVEYFFVALEGGTFETLPDWTFEDRLEFEEQR